MKHFISSLSVLCANTPPCEGRVSSRKILSLLLILFLSIGNVWAEETIVYTETFEDSAYKTSTTYNNSEEKKHGPTNTQWGVLCGTPNTGAYNGSKAFAMRYYKSVSKTPTLTQYFDINNVDAISFWSKTESTNNKLNVEYSTDGGSSWSSLASNISITTSYKEYSYNFSTQQAKVRLRFTMGTTTEKKSMLIDDIEFISTSSTGSGTEETVVSVPTFSIPEGTFYSPINVELSCETADAEIHYTLDGSTPSSTSEKYTTAIAISETTTIKAIAIKDGLTDSEVATATYTKGETITSYDIDFETNALEAYINWDFSNITITTATIQAKAGTYYANTSGKASASIKTKEVIQYPGILTFYTSKESGNTTSSSWKVQVSENGTTWTDVQSFDATTGNKGDWTEHTADLSDYENVYVQISYSGSTAIRAIDEISLAQGVAPVKYTLTIENPENGTLSVTKGGVSVVSGEQFKAGTSLVVTPTPASGYLFESLTVDGSAVELTDGTYTFTMPAADVTIAATFKANEKPAATLTLSKNGVAEPFPGSWKQDDVVTLPSITSDCVKAFVGWSADDKCATEPEYKAGEEYTLTETSQTLYAVYADVTGGGETTASVNMATYATANSWGSTSSTNQKQITINSDVKAVISAGGNSGKYYDDGVRIYQTESATITISTSLGELKSVKFTFTYSNSGTLLYGSTTLTSNKAVEVSGTSAVFSVGDTNASENKGQIRFTAIEVTYASAPTYSNYSTTCAAAPKAVVNPTAVSATAAGANDKVEVTYENVNTESVAVALFNDEACTEAFFADWLTASLDDDKNITYTVAATTLYTERKAYIKLTAPETTGATEPAVVVIPVTQAGKDKVFASLEALLAAITPTAEGVEVTVTLTNEVIQDFYTSGSFTNGIALNVPYEGGVKVIEIYCKDVPAEWVKGGKVSGTITCPWKLYNSTWELCPAAWTELTYTAPATVKSIAVSGTPTKTTYVDGEIFDPAGLAVTATLTDDSTEPIDFALVDWTFDPTTLVKGQTAVSVTATYNSVSSAEYEVTGLTVNDIPTKTVAEFIAAGGTRCYLEGIVSNIKNTTYGNFDLTDASGTIYVYGCLNASGEAQKFASLGVKAGDKIKVIADEYELYNGTTEEAKNVQYVSHISAATIEIADITMEVGETKTIAATITPDAAKTEVTYSIKAGSDDCITLSENNITARAEGTATIVATIATAEGEYMGKTVEFEVTVTPKTEKTNVVILAQYDGNWYALVAAKGSANNTLGAVEVTYVNGVILDFDGDKASITWERAVVGNKATFKNGTNYMKGATGSTNLTLETSAFEWEVVDGKYLVESKRTFLYNKAGYFKNYDANTNAGKTDFSAWPVVTAVEFMNSVTTPSVESGIFSVADDKFVQFSIGNLQYEVGTNTWSFASEQYDYVGEENINVGNPSYTGKIDMFGWSADGKFGVNPSNADADYTGEFADWGNLVNETGWYTLSADEWKYLLNTRANAANLKQIAKVGSVVGIMLFPDAWTMPTDVNVTAEYDNYFEVNIYNYTLEQWEKLEAVGAVFLPAAGRRAGGYGNMINKDQVEETNPENLNGGHYKHYDNGNIYCYYWTSTINESTKVSYLHNIQALGGDEYTIGTGAVWAEKGRYGQSVRLAKVTDITPVVIRDGLTVGQWGTLCPKQNVDNPTGATFYQIAYLEEKDDLPFNMHFYEVEGNLEAGQPYFFIASATQIKGVKSGEPKTEGSNVNGFYGYIGETSWTLPYQASFDVNNNNTFVIWNNSVFRINAETSIKSERCYIIINSSEPSRTSTPAPVGARRITMGVSGINGQNTATGVDQVQGDNVPTKMIINGQLFILRGEKMYDAQGKLVK